MIYSPGILALLLVSVLVAACSLYAAGAGLRVLLNWVPASSAKAQLTRERKMSLLSSILGFVMVADVLCLALFVSMAERMHALFTGAMCAAGSLNANAYGLPTLLVMLLGCELCVLWLVINHLDTLLPGFTLLRPKYWALLPVAVVLGVQSFLLVSYLIRLDPNLVTSCCATYFNEEGSGVGADLAHLPPLLMEPAFWGVLATTLAVGSLSFRLPGLDTLYAGLSLLMLPLGLAAAVSFISVRIYALPTHHCPFCLLKPEYGCSGYVLYAGLLFGSALGMGAGLVRSFSNRAGAHAIAGRMGRRLKITSLAGYAMLAIVAGYPLLFSELHLSANFT